MKIFDAHNDFITQISSDKKINNYINNKIINNSVCCSVWTTNFSEIAAINYIEKLNELKKQHKNIFCLVEDCHFIDSTNIDIVLSQTIDIAGLVWNNDNNLGGGAYSSSRLTEWGKIVLNKFEENGTIIDVAHTNEFTFTDVAKTATMPLICSHSAMYGVLNHPRNLKDYQIKIICDSGGLVGLTLVNQFLNGTNFAQISDLVEHIIYFAIKFGTKNLCIGTDFYGTKHLPWGLKNYNDFKRLEKHLLLKGFLQTEIEDIFYNNLNIFMQTHCAN